MAGNYRYEEERHRSQRGAQRLGEFDRGRDEDEQQDSQTERFGRGPNYDQGSQGERTWASGRQQYGYDEGFGRGNRSLGGRGSSEGYGEEENMGSQGFRDSGRQSRGHGQEYGRGGYQQGGSQQGGYQQGGYQQGGSQQGGYQQGGYQQGGYQQGGYQQGGYQQGGYGQGGYGQGGQRPGQYGQSGYGSGQRYGRGSESSRYESSSQADGSTHEPDEMRWGRQQGLYGSSEYAGYISSQRSQSDYQSHVGKGPKNWKRSDERIREEVNEALARHPEIDASDIEVKVQGGEITLTGTVNSRNAKRQAEDIAERVFGASEVQNQIRVKADGQDSSRDRTNDRELSRSTEREGRSTTDPQGASRTTGGTGSTAGGTTR